MIDRKTLEICKLYPQQASKLLGAIRSKQQREILISYLKSEGVSLSEIKQGEAD